MQNKKIIATFSMILVLVSLLFTTRHIIQSAQRVEQSVVYELSPMASITFNQDMNVMDPEYERVTLEQVNEITNLDSVQRVEYFLDIELYGQNLKVPYEEQMNALFEPIHQFIVNGVDDSKFSFLREEIIQIELGRTFNKEELLNRTSDKVPVLISEDFANLNHLTIGSDFSMDNKVYFLPLDHVDWESDEVYVEENVIANETSQFNVIGIFKLNQVKEERFIEEPQKDLLSNTMFVPEIFVESALAFKRNTEYLNYKQLYQQEDWWNKFEQDCQFRITHQKASHPVFILKETVDWQQFELEANKILSPSHQIQKVSTINELISR